MGVNAVPDPIRFPADLPYYKSEHQQKYYQLKVGAHDATDPSRKAQLEAEAAVYFDQNFQDIADTQGAITYWWEKFNPIGPGLTVRLQDHVIDGIPYDGVAYSAEKDGVAIAFKIGAAGAASASVASGDGLYAVVLDALPTNITIGQFTAWGKDAVQGLACSPDQFLVLYSQADGPRSGRADVRSA